MTKKTALRMPMPEQSNARGTRSSYLLNGRRITVADLLAAGLIEAGQKLQFDRPVIGQTHNATVTEDGNIKLDDGQQLKTPSAAAAAAAGTVAEDGWHAWAIESDGRSLDNLRQVLLAWAAAASAGKIDDPSIEGQAGAEPDSGPAQASQRRYEFLNHARSKADASSPEELTVSDLLALWDEKSRGRLVNQRIEADLANHGLSTSPEFWKVAPETVVQLISAAQEGPRAAVAQDPDNEAAFDVGITVGNLPSALKGVAWVSPDATFDQAITRMLLDDYSQLAVLSGQRNLRGAVTWKSIAQARHANPQAKLSDAIVPAHKVRYAQDLIDVLPTLLAEDFIFVQDATDRVAGIVTTADVVNLYGEMATPFFLIGELDQILRQIISRNFALDDLIPFCVRGGEQRITSLDELTMGDYQAVFANPGNWGDLKWPLDRVAFAKRLEEIRVIRNDITHFNPDPVPEGAVEKLRHMIRLLRQYGIS
jgi:CBS domain-containing protein